MEIKTTTTKPILQDLIRLNFNGYTDADTRERATAKGKKQGHQFRWKKNIILYIAEVRKMGNVGGHQSENELQRKQSEQEHIKRLTKKFLEVSGILSL